MQRVDLVLITMGK